MTNPRNPINPRLPAAAAAMYTPWTQPVRTPTRDPHTAVRDPFAAEAAADRLRPFVREEHP